MIWKATSGSQVNSETSLAAPLGGFNPTSDILSMSMSDAFLLDNWFVTPSGIESRDGYVTHITAIAKQCDRLWVYANTNGIESLWGTTDDGIFNFTSAGVCPSASIALVNGKTIATPITTGAGSYLMVVNGTDTLKQYDGTSWTSVGSFGTATTLYNYCETYRQRLFFVKKQSLEIEYLDPNSIAGVAINYPLGALFRRGGYIVALCVWTIDGGVGPEDNLCVITNRGEVAVFAGSDPATWSLQGVYYIGRPIGLTPAFKYGGDVLFITETGIIAMSSVIQEASIDRIATVSTEIRPYLITAAQQYFNNEGWQIISDPIKPLLLVNIPGPGTMCAQAVMNSQLQKWSTYSGLNALYFARMAAGMFFSGSDGTAGSWKVKRIATNADDGTNIISTMFQAYSRMGLAVNKKIDLVRPYFEADAAFQYNVGVSNNFQAVKELNQIQAGSANAALWGTAIWGAANWTSSGSIISDDWQGIADEYAMWKGLYLQVVANKGKVTYAGMDMLYKQGSHF